MSRTPAQQRIGKTTPSKAPRRSLGPFAPRNISGTLFTGYLPLLIATLLMVLPLIWMVVSSFKQIGEIINVPVQWLPHTAYTGNYKQAATAIPLLRMFANTALVTAIGASVKLVLAIFTAYALVFVRFPFKRVIFMLILVALMVPPQVSVLSNFIFISGLGGMNTYWGIILPGLGTAFGTFLLRQYFLGLPPAILESAAIDGASHWRRLWQIVVPISAPAIITVGLITIVGEWNDYLWPLVITDNPKFMTLSVGLTLLQDTEQGATAWGVLMAATVLVILPVLIIFVLLQRYVIAGLSQGATKG